MKPFGWIACWLLFLLPALAQEHPAATPPAAAPQTAPGQISAEKVWADLIEGNKRFVAGRPKAREFVQLRHTLAGGQHPKVVVLTCSDSRLSPELLFDKSLGELFVIRSAGNIADAV
ncbi:MAG TPA: carbonic anhydrase, partial [Terriglobales bacterium]